MWALLVFAHLQLQHNVRVGDSAMRFWPRATDGRRLGGPDRPTAAVIDVFEDADRVNALFAKPMPTRIHNKPSIMRKIMFSPAEPPTLAIWEDLWVANVQAGGPQAPIWPALNYDVVWRPSTVVFFSKPTHIAIDFMLLVGNANGTGDARPHVYMFRFKGSASDTLGSIVRGLDKRLTRLFSDDFDGHVLRRAGIENRGQVTLCINALQFGERVNATKLSAPFGVVLFGKDDFDALGGAAFKDASFFQLLAKKDCN